MKWNLLWTRETLGCVLPSPGTLTQQDKCLGSTIRIFLAVREPSILKSQYLLTWWDPLQHAPMGPSVQKDTIGKPVPSYCGQTVEIEPGRSGWTLPSRPAVGLWNVVVVFSPKSGSELGIWKALSPADKWLPVPTCRERKLSTSRQQALGVSLLLKT